MDRIIAPTGARLNLETVLTDLQTSVETNRLDLMERIFESYGTIYSGEEDTSLEIYDAGSYTAQVRPGYALTEAGDAIVVRDSDPISDRQIDITGYDGPIYIGSIQNTEEPTQILDGFAWLDSGTQYRDTHQYDYYELTKTDPGENGVLLATISDSGATITDNRADNRLQVKSSILSDWARERLHLQNTDEGTTSSSFRVGVGTLGTYGLGLEVDTIPSTPKDPLRPRISTITYHEIDRQIEDADMVAKIPSSLRAGLVSRYAMVTFDWGFDYLEGTGGTDEFTITGYASDVVDAIKTFSADELADYAITINGTDYIISGNDATDGSYHTRLDLVDVWGDPAGTVPSASSSNPASIHSDSTSYDILAVPYSRDTSSEIYKYSKHHQVKYGNPKKQSISMDLNFGWRYKVKVTSVNKTTESNTVTMAAGSFIQNSSTHSYDSDFLVQLPEIDMASASIGATATDYGFDITVTGMTDATDFELCWTADNSGADFENTDHYHKITYDRKIEITTNGSREYDIKLRPLQGGFVVSTTAIPYVTTSVISGGGGSVPNEKLLSFINVDMYAAQVDYADSKTISGSTATLDFTSLGLSLHSEALNGKRLYTQSGQEYEIETNTHDEVVVREIDSAHGELGDLDETSVIYIGDSSSDTVSDDFHTADREKARRIYTHTFPNDVRIVAMDFDCDITDGTESVPGVIRFYQSGYPEEHKSAEVWQTDYFYTRVPINLVVRGSKGARTLIIDAWDSAGIGNLVRLKGVLTIHYRDLTEDTPS